MSDRRTRRRFLTAVVGAAMVVSGCSSVGDEAAVSPSTAADAPARSPDAGSTSGEGGGQRSSDGVATGDAGTQVGTGDTSPTPTVASPFPSAAGPVGSLATTILRPAPAAQVVIEVQAQDGAEPRAGTVSALRDAVAGASGKEVAVRSVALAGGADGGWSADRIRTAADAAAQTPQGPAVVIRMLFVHGSFTDRDDVLGVAVRGDVAAVFVDDVATASSLLVSAGRIEQAVATHELGHLLGLVDLVLDTGREDAEHPGHSTNKGSVMYWAVESNLVADLLTGGPPVNFDAQDRADLAAIRNG